MLGLSEGGWISALDKNVIGSKISFDKIVLTKWLKFENVFVYVVEVKQVKKFALR